MKQKNLVHDSKSEFLDQYITWFIIIIPLTNSSQIIFRMTCSLYCSHLTWLLFPFSFYLNLFFQLILFYFNLNVIWLKLALLFNRSEHLILQLQVTLSQIPFLSKQTRLGILTILYHPPLVIISLSTASKHIHT